MLHATMHRHNACAHHATLHRADAASSEPARSSPARLLRRLAGLVVLLVVLPVFLVAMAVALPVALLVGGVDAAENLWHTARRQVRLHHLHGRHAHF